jgi:hypothetical protein
MDDSKRCRATSKRTGERCKRACVPGCQTCPMHGSGTAAARAAGERRLNGQRVTELAERLDVEVPEFTSAAEAARYLVGRLSRRAAQFGALADQHGDDAIYRDRAGQERIRAAFTGEQRWLGELARVLTAVAQADAARQRASADHEALFGRLAGAMQHAVADALLEYRESVPAAMMSEIAEKIQGYLAVRLRNAGREPAPEPERSRYPG